MQREICPVTQSDGLGRYKVHPGNVTLIRDDPRCGLRVTLIELRSVVQLEGRRYDGPDPLRVLVPGMIGVVHMADTAGRLHCRFQAKGVGTFHYPLVPDVDLFEVESVGLLESRLPV